MVVAPSLPRVKAGEHAGRTNQGKHESGQERIKGDSFDGRVIDAGDELPEGFGVRAADAVGCPGAELAGGIVGVEFEPGGADEDRAVEEEEIIAGVLGLGGDAHDGVGEAAEEPAIDAEEFVGIVPDVKAVFAGDADGGFGAGAEEAGDAAWAVDAAEELATRDGALELVAEGLETGDARAVEGTDFGIALAGEERGKLGTELDPATN